MWNVCVVVVFHCARPLWLMASLSLSASSSHLPRDSHISRINVKICFVFLSKISLTLNYSFLKQVYVLLPCCCSFLCVTHIMCVIRKVSSWEFILSQWISDLTVFFPLWAACFCLSCGSCCAWLCHKENWEWGNTTVFICFALFGPGGSPRHKQVENRTVHAGRVSFLLLCVC